MAIPSRGTVLLWQEGSAEANKMIAVGVNEIYKSSPLAVSPDLYKWDGKSGGCGHVAVSRLSRLYALI